MMNEKKLARLSAIIIDALYVLSIEPRKLKNIPTTRNVKEDNIWNMISNKYYPKNNNDYKRKLNLKQLWVRNSHKIQHLVFEKFSNKSLSETTIPKISMSNVYIYKILSILQIFNND